MSTTLEKLMIRIGTEVSGVPEGFEKVSKSMDRIAMDAAKVGAAVTGVYIVFDRMVERGGKVANVQEAFANRVGDSEAALKGLRGQTKGLISDYDLMVGYNKAAVLGSARTTQEFGELAQVAIRLGKALGMDVGYALESLNTGIARQSKLWLDNLGIIVSVADANEKYAEKIGKSVAALSDAEKKEGFREEALRAAKDAIEDLGEVTDTAADDAARFRTELANIRDQAALLVAESDDVSEALKEWGLMLQEWRGIDTEVEAATAKLLANFGERSLDRIILLTQEAQAEVARLKRESKAFEDIPLPRQADFKTEAGHEAALAKHADAGKQIADDLAIAEARMEWFQNRISEMNEEASAAMEKAFVPRGLEFTIENMERLTDEIESTEAAIEKTKFDLAFAKNAKEADDLRVKIQNLEGRLLSLNRVADAHGGAGHISNFLGALSGPISGTGLSSSINRAGERTWNGFRVGAVPSLGLDPVKPLLKFGEAVEDTIGPLQNLQKGFAQAFDSLLDPTMIGSNLASNLASWGIGTLVGAIFGGGGPSPEERAIAEAMEKNRQALERNTAALEQDLMRTAPGNVIAGVSSALESYLWAAENPNSALSGLGFSLPHQSLEDELEAVGLAMEDLKDIAKELGLEWVDSVEFYTQLRNKLREVTSQDLLGTFGGKLSFQAREWELLDISDPAEKIASIMAVLMENVTGDIAAALAQVDWADPNEFLMELMASIRAGTLDFGELELPPEDFLAVIAQLESFGDELAGANEELAAFGNSLRNAPAGFKVALARYHSSSAEARPFRTDPPGSGGTTIGTLNFNVSDPVRSGDQLWAELQKVVRKETARGGVSPLDAMR